MLEGEKEREGIVYPVEFVPKTVGAVTTELNLKSERIEGNHRRFKHNERRQVVVRTSF